MALKQTEEQQLKKHTASFYLCKPSQLLSQIWKTADINSQVALAAYMLCVCVYIYVYKISDLVFFKAMIPEKVKLQNCTFPFYFK